MLGFKSASNGSLAKFDLQDQIVDEFIDNSGVDTGASTNANVGSGVVSSGAPGNYFGDGSDGDVTISGNTTLTVQNTNGSYDGDMVFKQYNTLTINAGQTLSTNVPCRGLFIYVRGNCNML